MTGIPQAEGRLTITNGDPGLRALLIVVNGRRFVELRLKDDEARQVDISAAMRPGDNNVVELTALGRRGTEADVLFWDGVGAEEPDPIRRTPRVRPPRGPGDPPARRSAVGAAVPRLR